MTLEHKLEPAINEKLITGQRKTRDLDELAPEPAIWSSIFGQRIPCFDSCQFEHNMDVYHQSKHRLQAPH